MILFYIQSSVVAQSCESIQQHRFSGSLKLEIKSCIEPLQIQLIWQNKDKTIRQNYFNLDAVDVETQQYGDVIALDFY